MPHPDLLAVLKPIFEKALERPPPTTTTKSTISVSIALIIRYQHFMHEKEKVACFEHNKTPTRAVFLTAFSFLSFSNFFFRDPRPKECLSGSPLLLFQYFAFSFLFLTLQLLFACDPKNVY